MNNLQVFKNGLFEVALKLDNQEIVFDAERVAKSLGITQKKNGNEYVRWERVNEYLKASPQVGKDDFIPEAAVYKLAFKASNEVAEKFQDWLAIEVIPQIRKTGGYIPTSEDDDEASIMAKALMIAQKTISKKDELLQKQTQELENKNKFINQIAVSENSLLVREVAKIASKEGIKIGERRLWDRLRMWGLIFKKSTEPKQEYIDRGYFEVVEGSRESSKGVFVYHTTRVTGKGQVYIINKLLKEKEAC